MSQSVTMPPIAARFPVRLTIRRVIAVLLLILIIPTTVTAFWLFNANRVVLDSNTYKNSLNNRTVYHDLFGALLGGFVSTNTLPRHAEVLLPLLVNSPDAADLLFPSDYAQKQIDSAVDQLNGWVNGRVDLPNVTVNLTALKDKLTNDTEHVVSAVLRNTPPCRASQESQIRAFGDNDSFEQLLVPLCLPTDPATLANLKKQLSVGFSSYSIVLPDSWKLLDELSNLPEPVAPGSTSGSSAARLPRPAQLNTGSLSRTRVDIWLQTRLMVLLFLIPIALMCLIVIVIIRSTKHFFRWLSWALILSGFVSLVPVLLITLGGLSARAENVNLYSTASDVSELALNALARGAVQSIISTLILGVLIQVAILIVVGLLAAFLSILLSSPDPLFSDADLEALIAMQSGVTPTPVAMVGDSVPGAGTKR